jgi:hypothetical protein
MGFAGLLGLDKDAEFIMRRVLNISIICGEKKPLKMAYGVAIPLCGKV